MSEEIFNNAIYLDDVPQNEWRQKYIGPGYRYVCYTLDQDRNGKIILFGYDLVGNPKTFICPWQSYIKYRVKYDTNEKDIYGNFVETRKFKSSFERKKRLEEIGNSLFIVECLKPEQEFLQAMFYDVSLNDDFNKQPLRVQFIDIETEISDVFEKPADARNRINMITIYDSKYEKYFTWSLDHAEIDFKEEPLCNYPKDKFEFFEFNNKEADLLEHFLSWIEANYPDVSYGWNTKGYDWPYIVRRIENVLGKSAAQRLSPISKYRIKDVNHANERADVGAEIEVDIQGLFIADGLVLYRDKFLMAPALDGGYNLSNVGEHEDLGRKIEYDGTLKDLYIKDYQKFYEYNVRDVDLVVKIEQKCKLINLSRQVAGSGLCNYDMIYSSIAYLIGSLISYSKLNMNRTFQSYLNQKNEKEEYEGAYVFPPVKGVYRGGIATFDVNSLYPSTIRSVNLSPETYVGKLSKMNVMFDDMNSRLAYNKEEPIDLNDPELTELWLYPANNGKRKKVNKADVMKLIESKCIYTRNNTLFMKHSIKQGVVSGWCKYFYNLRKTTKKSMQKLEMDVYNNKVAPENLKCTEDLIQNLDAKQHALKIMINSVYGILGTSHSPIYNHNLAQTITRNGKFFNTNAAKFTFNYFKENFGIDDTYPIVASGDTDSFFLNIDCVTKSFKKKYNLGDDIAKWSDDDKLNLWKYMDNFGENVLNPHQQELIKNYCHTEHPEVLRYSMEYIGACGIYEAKKHYGVYKILSEGPEIVNKIKYSGIELKKATVPKKIKGILGEIYSGILTKNWKESDFAEYIQKAYDDFRTLSIDDLAMWKGYNTAREADGFLSMAVGATGISSACTYYNQMIDKLGLGKKYDQILLGQKVRFCYVLPDNEYGISYIAYHDGQWPKEFDQIFHVDYDVMFDKLILSALKGFIEATRFKMPNPAKPILFDIFQL